MTYGIILWDLRIKSTLQNCVSYKKNCAILQTNFHEHSHPHFTYLNLIKLQDIYKIEIAIFMYSYIHSTLPFSFSNIFTFTHGIHNHDTRQLKCISPISSSTDRSSNIILCKDPLIWNKVPYDIKSKRNIQICISIKGISFKWL